MIQRSLSLLLIAGSLTTGLSQIGRADMARHGRLFAVPAPANVVIDGKLGDWDLSGQIHSYVLEETSASQSARFAVMYDAEALYLSSDVRDPSPMMNRHNPRVDSRQGWDADACQFRLVMDPKVGYPATETKRTKKVNDQYVHLTLWYYTDAREPVLQVHHGMHAQHTFADNQYGLIAADQFEAVYVAHPDGGAYTLEYRIPWATLKAKTIPRAGDLVAGNVQFNWGRPDGMKTGGFAAWAYDVMNGPGHPWKDSRSWGRLIFSEKGSLPRELVEKGTAPERGLPLTFAYALPEDSEVTVAVFNEEGMLVRNILAQQGRTGGDNLEKWDGLDDLGKPVAPGNYTWKGIYHDPITTKFVLSVHNSGQPPYKLDNNRGGWGGDHGLPVAVCSAGDFMVLGWDSCEAGWGVIRTDLDGKKLWGNRYMANHLVTDGERIFLTGGHGFATRPGISVLAVTDGRPMTFGNGIAELEAPGGGEAKENTISGMAVHDGVLYVSYAARDMIALFDAIQGDLKTTWTVPSPSRLAARPDGAILAISSGSVVSVRDGVAQTVISGELSVISEAVGLAVGADGQIYVGNRGELHNVAVFSPDGKYLRSIGKAGGRPWRGTYDASGMLNPAGMDVDSRGQLWIAEELDSPKRVSVWNTADGTLAAEYFGGGKYATWASMDPKHADEVYCHNVIWNVDLDAGTWSPKSTAWRARKKDDVHEPGNWGYNGHPRVITASNGQRFVWGMWNYAHVLMMQDGDVFKPIAAAIRMHRKAPRADAHYALIYDDPKTYPDGAYLWQDANDDQAIQKDEITSVDWAPRASRLINWVDKDLNLWCDTGHIVSPARFEGKRPIYDFTKTNPSPFTTGHSNFTGLWLDDEGFVYTLFGAGRPPLAKWTRDGVLVWAMRDVPNWQTALSRPIMKAGQVWGPTMPLGAAGDYTGVATYFGPFHIFTLDGICVAKVFRDIRMGGLGPNVIGCEAFSGQLVKPDDMNRYFILGGDQDGRVTEILGLDSVKRLAGGTLTISVEESQRAADAVEQFEKQKTAGKSLVIARGRSSLPYADPIERRVDANRKFSARAAYDQHNLYIAFDVHSPHGLINAETEPRLVFKGGNLLDIQIAVDASADGKRKKPAPGDVRILITQQADKPVAVIYRPKVKDHEGEPIVLKSPTGTESFDAIEVSDAITLTYRPKAGQFHADVTIPLKELAWTPQPGTSIRMDLGYIFGNKTGTMAALRAYWANNGFSANVVGDIPNESRLEPHEWGQALLE